MNWINEDGTTCDPQPTPEQEGRRAAQARFRFDQCPYTYANSGVTSMDEYAATGNNAKRNQWFKGWRDEQTGMDLDSRFHPLKGSNVPHEGPAQTYRAGPLDAVVGPRDDCEERK